MVFELVYACGGDYNFTTRHAVSDSIVATFGEDRRKIGAVRGRPNGKLTA